MQLFERIHLLGITVETYLFSAMIHPTLRKHCTINTLVQLLCTLLTLLLIYQELVTFTVTRPTTVSSEEKILDPETFPEISVCLEPGLNSTAISDLGYQSFYRGSMDGQRFVGWNGMKENNNIGNIVEDMMTMKMDQHYFKKVLYHTPGLGYNILKQFYTHPFYPRGKCLTLSTLHIPNWFLLIFNTSFHGQSYLNP